jgi:hypothetical protein
MSKSLGLMKLREEWAEFELMLKKITPKRCHKVISHKFFPYFVFGYPVIFVLFCLLALSLWD